METKLTEDTKLLQDNYQENGQFEKIISSWIYLSVAPRDLWLIYSILFFQFLAFFAFITTLAIFLVDARDYSDSAYSLIFGLVGICGIIYSALLGNFGDTLGLRTTMIISNILNTALYLLLAIIDSSLCNVVILIIFGQLGTNIGNPALQASIKIHTSEKYRNLAVSCFVSIFYTANLFGSVVLQLFLGYFGTDVIGFRILYATLLVPSCIALFLSLFVNDCSQDPEICIENQQKVPGSIWEHVHSVVILKRFWRLILTVFCLVGVKLMFYQQTIVLPLYMDRDLGSDTLFGLMMFLNQAIAIICMPLLAVLSYWVSYYDMFVFTGFISVISPTGFLFWDTNFSVYLYIAVSSVGEAMYNFAITNYIFEITPRGKESVVFGFINIPHMIGHTVAGVLGGLLMDNYCPEEESQNCWKIWAALSAISIPPTLILFFSRKWLEDKLFEANPYIPCVKESKEY